MGFSFLASFPTTCPATSSSEPVIAVFFHTSSSCIVSLDKSAVSDLVCAAISFLVAGGSRAHAMRLVIGELRLMKTKRRSFATHTDMRARTTFRAGRGRDSLLLDILLLFACFVAAAREERSLIRPRPQEPLR